MKLLNLLLLIVASLCLSRASLISELKDKKRDIENYLKVNNIERYIPYNHQRTLDVYYDKKNTTDKKPVFVFIYGGSWYSGDNVKFTNFGTLIEENDYIAVLPNYVLFPFGVFEDMVEDVYEAIKWTYNNISKYGGNPEDISVAAYSAGSHLTALTILKAALGYKNKGKMIDDLPQLNKVVLLNGPYDFDDYAIQDFLSDEDADNGLIEQLVKLVFRTENVSPTDLLKPIKDNSVTSLGANKFIFFYTSLDNTVRESSAKGLINQMKRVYPEVSTEYVYKEGYDHTTLTRGVRAGEDEQKDIFVSLMNM